MKRLTILICLLLISGGFFFAQEVDTENPPQENPEIQQEIPAESQTETEQDDSTEQEIPPEQDDAIAEDTEPETEDDYVEDAEFVYKMNQKGDQFIKIGLMVDIPLRPATKQLKVGGSGTLGYMRFLNSNLAVGGDASFAYMTTIGKNVFTCIPLMAKVMYQFTVGKFEIPLTLGIGGAFQNYLGDTYFGLIIKPEVGTFFRYSPSWSFGANVGWNLMPQWTKDSSYFGVIMDAGITARYHF